MSILDERPIAFVGEAPAKNGAPPWKGLSGLRLAEWSGLGRDYEKLKARATLVNLTDTPAPGGTLHPTYARAGAEALAPSLVNHRVILCGRRVAVAFDAAETADYVWESVEFAGIPLEYATIPHPSGQNRAWNDREQRARCERFLRETFGSPQELTEEEKLDRDKRAAQRAMEEGYAVRASKGIGQDTRDQIFELRVKGGGVEAIAKALAINPELVRAEVKSKEFAKRLHDYREQRAASIGLVLEQMEGHAVKTVADVMGDANTPPSVRLQAARMVFEIVGRMPSGLRSLPVGGAPESPESETGTDGEVRVSTPLSPEDARAVAWLLLARRKPELLEARVLHDELAPPKLPAGALARR